MRLLACLAALVLLGGCNMVITHKPMFTQATGAGAPIPRAGLWRLQFGDDCKVDDARPLSQWPSCAGGVVFGAGTVTYLDQAGEKATWKTDPLILAAGQPIVGQAKLNVSGDVKLTGEAYVYVGIRPLKLDEAGRFTRFEFWPVQCGPPVKAANRFFTDQPAAGVKIEPITALAGAKVLDSADERMCTIDDPAVMRRVAAQSEAWVKKKAVGRWVRDKPD